MHLISWSQQVEVVSWRVKEYLVYRMGLLVHSIPVSSSSISLREQSDDFSEGRGGAGGRGGVCDK